MILRDYQTRMLEAARSHMRAGKRRVLLVAPTGAGKRLMAVHAIATAVARGKRCCFIVHRQELLDQSSETLDAAGVRHGIIKAGARPDLDWPCQVASVQSLARRLDSIPPFDFLFVDEAHHSAAATWSSVLAAMPQAWMLGFTATPIRLDGKGLARYADAMVVGPGTRELIDAGYLADYRLFAPPATDLSGIHTVGGDYNRGELADAIDRPKIVGDAVAHYQRLAPGTQAIVFAVNIRHSFHLAEAFNDVGISARHIDGDTPRDERAMAIEDFAARRFKVLCNVDLIGEGLDIPGIETVVCARPTQSLSVYLQQVGRGLRVKPDGRRALILDHAGNSRRHGLPDEPREWELTEDRIKRPRAAAEVSITICPRCFAAMPAGTDFCPECGHALHRPPHTVEHAKGDLAEVTEAQRRQQAMQARRERGRAQTLDELIALGRARNYRFPVAWAKHVLSARARA